MSLPLRIRPEATGELNEAWNWYEERREGLGDELLGCVEVAFASVQRNPQAHRRVEGRIRQAIVRRFPYVVLFVEYPDYVEVLAVFHTSRDPTQWQGRLGFYELDGPVKAQRCDSRLAGHGRRGSRQDDSLPCTSMSSATEAPDAQAREPGGPCTSERSERGRVRATLPEREGPV